MLHAMPTDQTLFVFDMSNMHHNWLAPMNPGPSQVLCSWIVIKDAVHYLY